MTTTLLFLVALGLGQKTGLEAGFHKRTLRHEGFERSYLVHIPRDVPPGTELPVLLALHGATMDAQAMAWFSGLNALSQQERFVVVYPNGTGPLELLQTWNAGTFPGGLARRKVDDIGFLKAVLDDVQRVAPVDRRRVYATGMSNGAMMCYRLAAEMADRIAAIAPVAGTLALDRIAPKRPVPILHFHGTKDTLVPFEGNGARGKRLYHFHSVPDTVQAWVKANHCEAEPTISSVLPGPDGLKIQRRQYHPKEGGAEVVLYVIEGGGHTWPGRDVAPAFLGKCARHLPANHLIWEFFRKYRLEQAE